MSVMDQAPQEIDGPDIKEDLREKRIDEAAGSEYTNENALPSNAELEDMTGIDGAQMEEEVVSTPPETHFDMAANAREKIDAATKAGDQPEANRLSAGAVASLRSANAERATSEQDTRRAHLQNMADQGQIVAPGNALDKPATKPEGLVSKLRNLFRGGDSKQSGGE